ncbi:hypothetical protein ABIE87_006458 [Bradyrhizobium diazoefficiens]|jgi:hypothetical protein
MTKPDYEYRYNELKKYVLDYLSEVDNPVPDYGYRRTLRNHMRALVGAPDEPKPRSTLRQGER